MSSPTTAPGANSSRATLTSSPPSDGAPLGRLEDFDFALPAELVAQHPPVDRSASRLLRVTDNGSLHDSTVRALPDLLRPGDLLVFNDTRVLKARLFGHKDSGGQVEILVERILDHGRALVQIRASHAPREGGKIHLARGGVVTVASRDAGFFQLQTEEEGGFAHLLESQGELPLPPYIERPPQAQDEARYQTVYAAHPGAVAAPTAGLHFDDPLLERLRGRGIATAFLTLHVGAGTFQPVRVSNLDEHRMHRERYVLSIQVVDAISATRAAGRQVVAVGTTTLRALESAALDGELRAGAGETGLFIRPGFRFRVVDRLMTNFHLPRSTLLMLVSAFAGYEPMQRAYAHAVRERYRFFSYGDAMLLDRADGGADHAI